MSAVPKRAATIHPLPALSRADPAALSVAALVAALPQAAGARALALLEILGASWPHLAEPVAAAQRLLSEAQALSAAVADLAAAVPYDGADRRRGERRGARKRAAAD